MSLTIRPYQSAARQAVEDAWARNAAPLLVMATGTGKTMTALHTVVGRGRVVWLAHRAELLTQPLAALRKHWPDVRGGIVQAARDDVRADVIFASVATLRTKARREALLAGGPIDVLVVDEAHHSPSPTHRAVIAALRSESTRLLGLTATPDREDGADLSEHWEIAYSYDIQSAVRDGYLLDPYASVQPIDLDLSAVDVTDDEAVGLALLDQGIAEATVAAMTRGAHFTPMLSSGGSRWVEPGAPTLVFTASVKQAEATTRALISAGIAARTISGLTAAGDRRRLLRAFELGDVRVLCSPAVLTEGTDLPIAQCAVLARPYQSWSLYVQSVGRVLRPYAGQDVGLVLDLVGATRVHSLIAAPALVGAVECEAGPEGRHEWGPVEKSAKGECRHCQASIPCYARLGPHDWTTDPDAPRMCTTCGSPQCPESPDGWHAWVRTSAVEYACIECGATSRDVHAGVLRARKPIQADKDVWVRLEGLASKAYAADVPRVGMLIVVEADAQHWACHWLPKGARNPRTLGGGPLPRDLARSYADEILRRASRHASRAATSDQQRHYAAQLGIDARPTSGETSRAIVAHRARQRAIDLGLAVAA